MNLLLISNGHGEDAMGATLASELARRGFELEALPIVGEGGAYRRAGIPILGATRAMPSGGFVYGRPAALAGDLAHGLVGLTLGQIASLRSERSRFDVVLAIGDIVVLAFAWLARTPFAFVGCAKSDYYLHGRPGAYLWHERALMRHPRCQGVYPRDEVTTRNLVAAGIRATYLGNPMMDGLEARGVLLPGDSHAPTVLLLPGSRPEAPANLAILGEAARAMRATAPGSPPRFLVAVATGMDVGAWAPGDWHAQAGMLDHPDGTRLYLVAGAFADAAHAADLVLAMAGTATEQVVGLGKAVITTPGPGPQFTAAFAEAQTRLLGESICLVPDPDRMAHEAWSIWGDKARLLHIAQSGRSRMGEAGAASRIADEIASHACLQIKPR